VKVVEARYGQPVINGGHVIIYSADPEANRAFFADVLAYPHLDAGGGWLIFRVDWSGFGCPVEPSWASTSLATTARPLCSRAHASAQSHCAIHPFRRAVQGQAAVLRCCSTARVGSRFHRTCAVRFATRD
jgi:catechol 2,3-dioxygenase-like lactoylglutathione lyase family enzyme